MIRKCYIDLDEGQLHYATAGDAGPRIVLLHESPLSHRMYDGVIVKMAQWNQELLLGSRKFSCFASVEKFPHPIARVMGALMDQLQ